ncbi:S-adenosyl-L-methionine-dependent methyltransferase [Amylocarpus encephaloides]|uniref:S-adenosyl-L-methionine-dependent methyltransferase n=1 Tax=Amylocarpus encephaloides TaxID=45428 RepID=A0A9P7YG48_9HELO|nr:S-adenosyl-L-methionine-dependent methyltransferase [Amylocarpus encephaloides]
MATQSKSGEDHWDSSAYQSAASFVPKLATKVIGWLDVQKDDVILDIGCGDGVLNLQIAGTLSKGTGKIHGVDSSASMIDTAQKDAAAAGVDGICTFEVLDATKLSTKSDLASGRYDKVFSNAALHWILRPEENRDDFFKGVYAVLKRDGIFCFEMGGFGNVAEMHTVFLSVLTRRLGITAARAADPWFFPDETWMSRALASHSFEVVKIEREYRPTKVDASGVAGWVELMGKQFFDKVEEVMGKQEREQAEREAIEVLGTVCGGEGVGEGGDWIGYVRLRGVARKI